MIENIQDKFKKRNPFFHIVFTIIIITIIFLFFINFFSIKKVSYKKENTLLKNEIKKIPPLDIILYDNLINYLANNLTIDENNTNTNTNLENNENIKKSLWPVSTVYPKAGAILPFNRIVAYYGNLYSKKMGALGEYKEEEMLQKLNLEVEKWNNLDSSIPAIPALHYIAIVAQEKAGNDGKYRIRMPKEEIDKVLKMAEKINAIVFLDIQVGFSTLEEEILTFEEYLKMPNVHLGIDPEFSMKGDIRPGKIVGTLDAKDINLAVEYLAKIVKENNLTPKILVVHRYTQKMVTNYKEIKILPEVQIVMNMDGWGGKAHKINTYKQFIYKEPVQFTGFKLFYKNDILEPNTTLMTPEDLFKLSPRPIYIQYQ